MTRSIALLLCGVLVSAAGVSASPDDSYAKYEVMDTLEAMARAYVKKDIKTLDAIYHDDMTYGHTTGEVQTKADVLEAVRTRTTESFELSDSDIHIYGSVAIYRGVEHLGIGGDKPNMSVGGVMWVLTKGNGPNGWQIIARQDWPLPPR
jgi:ketosteroid isomerase-like protein